MASARRLTFPILLGVCLSICRSTVAVETPHGSPESPNFARDILPILSDRCALCHGPDSAGRQADLRVDVPEVIDKETENGQFERIIVPGNPDDSELMRRILSTDPDEQMPPPEANLALTKDEIEDLRQWIADGAAWEKHWSFRAVVAPAVPAGESSHPVDRFLAISQSQAGIQVSPLADRYTQLRRLSLDLTGLPPTPADIESYLADSSPSAYQRQVERLLASPEFGQQMAVSWLDAARYADTYGYQADVYREVWPWRDWVVDAFRSGMPYDQFLTWQLAGDLLPDATRQSRLATAFNRLHRQTNEGGSVEEEFRAEYIADRVNTLGTAVLGLTLECARCHDHKYDPISQQDYYRLAAFFANIDESGLYSHFTNHVPTPALDLPSPAQQQALSEASAQVQLAEESYLRALRNIEAASVESAEEKSTVEPSLALADELARYTFGSNGAAVDYTNSVGEGQAAQAIGSPQAIELESSPGDETHVAVLLDGENGLQTPVGGDWDWWQPFSIGIRLRPQELHDRAVIWHRSRAWTDAASCGYELLLEEGRLSFALIHFWPGDAVRIRTVDPLPVGAWSHVLATSDGSGQAAGLRLFVDGQLVETEVVRDHLTRTIRGGGATHLAVGNRFRDRGFKGGQIDDLRIFARDLTRYEAALVAGLTTPTGDDSQKVDALHHANNEAVRRTRDALSQARARYAAARDAIPAIMTMEETAGLHDTFVLRRGQYDAPGERVDAGVPEAIAPFPADLPQNRVGLARWLTDSDPQRRHPLVARVAVNRVWQQFFEQGLVTTPEDFGLQGQAPVHADLLDYLAARFIEEGWDIKWLVRHIVTSDTYRRSAQCAPQVRESDPENVLLARGPAARRTVETIRDCALAAAGLLDLTDGGPPVRPYQPAGLWEEKSGAAYQRQVGAESHRRSLYTIWKRTSPPPSMIIFDAPGREVCVAGRTVTQTPLQALVLLNDEQFVEAARGAAFNALLSQKENAFQADAVLEHLALALLGRPLNRAEQTVLLELAQVQEETFASAPQDAEQFLAIGDFQWQATTAASQLQPGKLAAWTIVAQTIMNLQEWVAP